MARFVFFIVFFFIAVPNTQAAAILDLPFQENFSCFWDSLDGNFQVKPGCEDFYVTQCGDRIRSVGIDGKKSFCTTIHACHKIYDPVYDEKGLFYPNRCWAKKLGAEKIHQGISPRMKQFIQDLWASTSEGLIVPTPDIEFSYLQGGWEGAKGGAFFRSTLWTSAKEFFTLDFNINTTTKDRPFSVNFSQSFVKGPVLGATRKVLLISVPFDDTYPEEVLLSWPKKYEKAMNDYFSKKQAVEKPIQFEFTPVIVKPPRGISVTPQKRISETVTQMPKIELTEKDKKKIVLAGLKKARRKDFDMVVLSPVYRSGGAGGYFGGNFLGKEFISAPLGSETAYDPEDPENSLTAIYDYHNTFITISHEILHALGLSGDHFPMGYGTSDIGLHTSQYNAEGETLIDAEPFSTIEQCREFSTDPAYYGIELPKELQIKRGEEPSWALIHPSLTGSCVTLSSSQFDDFLKDMDHDGVYEVVFFVNRIGKELQGNLGWIDLDGDGKAEIEDPDPYGGIQKREPLGEGFKTISTSGFQAGKKVNKNGCQFQHITLETGEKGLLPLACKEFEPYLKNVYRGMKYDWVFIKKPFGNVVIPRLEGMPAPLMPEAFPGRIGR